MVSKTPTLSIYITPFKDIKHPHYQVTNSNERHELDLLYSPDNVFDGNTYNYTIRSVDVATRYRVAGVLNTKKARKVVFVSEAID